MDADQLVDNKARVELYRFFVEHGRPPVPAELAETLGERQSAVEDSLRRLADAHVLVLAPGTSYVWMANPLSAAPTSFPVEAGGRTWFGSCIWDALGVIAMLGGDGNVRSWCPDCGEPLAVAVEHERLASGEGVAHYALPAAQWWDDIGFT